MNWPEFNLMPHREWARVARRRRFWRLLVGGASAVLVLALLVFWGLDQAQRRLSDQLHREQGRLAQIAIWAKQRQEAEREIAAVRAERELIASLQRRQVQAVDLWRAVHTLLPSSSALHRLVWSPRELALWVDGPSADVPTLVHALNLGTRGWQGFRAKPEPSAERRRPGLGRVVIRANAVEVPHGSAR